jgi:formylglycine-generating enzyme required for sulfatase activity
MKRPAIRLAVLALLLVVFVLFWSLVPSLRAAEDDVGTTTTLGNAGAAAKPKEATLDLGEGVKLTLVWVPGGSFTMGTRASAEDLAKRYGGKAGYYAREHPAHEVALDGFWMGKYEVTYAQFLRFRIDHYRVSPERKSPGDSQPAGSVSWEGAKAFCAWLSGKSGKTIEIPSEAQWEYACRAGTTTERYWGDDEASMGRYANVRDRAWKAKFPDVVYQPVEGGMLAENMTVATDDGHAFAAPVGSFVPNAFGLYDMIGNVEEWCQDYYGEAYYGSSAGRNPTGPETGVQRVLRGGSWLDGTPWVCRSAFRSNDLPSDGYSTRGFRVVASRID